MKSVLAALVGIVVGVACVSACVGDDSTTPVDGGSDVTTPVDASGLTESGATCDGGQVCSGACIDTSGDMNNCGRCAHSCGTGQCSSGVCQPVLIVGDPNADGGTVITSLTTDQGDDNPQGAAQHIFWGETTNAGGIFQDNVLGGNTIKISTTGPIGAGTNVVVSGTNVFWFGYNAGGSPQPILVGQVGQNGSQAGFSTINGSLIQSILFDATNNEVCGSLTLTGQYSIFKCPLSTKVCTAVTTLTGVVQGNVASDGTKLYVADSDNGGIESVTLGAASTAMPFVTNQATPTLVRVDGTIVYWFDSGTKTIERQTINTVTSKQVATASDAITGLAADPVNVYWTDPTSGEVVYAPINGAGPNTPYVTSLGVSSSPMRLVRDSAFLYFSHNAAIYRIALP